MAKKRKKEGKKLSLKLIDEQKKKIVRLFQKGYDDKADSLLETLRKKLTHAPELLAENLIDVAEKLPDYKKKNEISEEIIDILIGCGFFLTNFGKYKQAIEKYEQALNIKPQKPKQLMLLLNEYGLALEKMEQYEAAAEKYKQALQIEPNSFKLLYNYGGALVNIGHCEEAIEQYEKASKIKPDDPDNLRNYGLALEISGQNKEAIEKYEQALKIKPDDPECLTDIGGVFIKSGHYEAAINCLERASEIQPDDFRTLNNYGAALAGIGLYDAAIKKCEQALSITSANQHYGNILYLNIAMLYYLINSSTQGNKYFELAIEHSEDKDAQRIRVAQHIFSVNPYSQDGIDILREITETSPDYSEAFNMLSLNLSPKEYWQMFNTRSDAASLRDNEMLNRAIYHKIKNEISILKDIVYEIISDYQGTDSIFSGIIGSINSVFRGIEQRRNKEKEQVKEFPNDDYERIIKIISDTAHDINDFVNNELAVIEADIRDILSELSTGESPYQELQELLSQIKITQRALNDLKNINQGIKIRYTQFQVKELFQNWANNRKLQNATISLDIDNSESVFNGDEQKIKSFLNELVDNSITHNSDKEDLEIRITSKDVINPPEIRGKDIPGEQKFLFIGCNDNGKGVPSDKKKIIFLPLETTSDISSGLGLFIIKRTLHEMNGYILESGENGANFKIFIPYANGEAEWMN
ncbi:MAG: tetratricopeptide repeat protein [Desulfobacterales bacterium]|nr:tetratricopeptide repeat protein [Desulfobacterales bacterium]